MNRKRTALIVGDAMIAGEAFEAACSRHLGDYVSNIVTGDWESDWGALQHRRLEIEKGGPGVDSIPDDLVEAGKDAEILLGLFLPISDELLSALPRLRVAGVSRAGIENVDLEAASRRGIAVFNVEGRNAEAVSDFAVGMMIAESRNIARAHAAMKQGEWRKEFSNSAVVPQLEGKCVGIVGFGHIGRLLARKLSGFDVRRLVYDPFVPASEVTQAGCESVDIETLFTQSDFVSLHARLSGETRNMVNAELLEKMKPSAYLVNTARAGLIDEQALAKALGDGRIAGAALDVFETEPLPAESPLRGLDNVTLTTHIAGTTYEALSNSPHLLAAEIARVLAGEEPRFLKNPKILEHKDFAAWLEEVRRD